MVVAGGCDYYPGSATSSPGFSFSVSDLRVAGEGDLLARIDRLRKQLDAEGLLERQKRLPRPLLPRTIGVVTGESGKARDDLLAGARAPRLGGHGWCGRSPPCRTATPPRRSRARSSDLAAVAGVEVVIVARGGGSLADLLCFCDETLCRTVALLAVPVIASVGHHTDRTLLDDVAAVSCSTPTHAAEAAVGIDCNRARSEQLAAAARLHEHARRALQVRSRQAEAALRLREHGRRAVLSSAQRLASLSRAPAAHLERQRSRLHQQLREIRAGSRRRLVRAAAHDRRRAVVLGARSTRRLLDCRERRPRELERLAAGARRARSAADARARLRARAARPPASRWPARPRAREAQRAASALRRRGRSRRGSASDERPQPTSPRRCRPQPQTYEAAARRVEEIIRRLDSGEASLSETLALVERGQGADRAVRRRARAPSARALEELRLDELVARLEQEAGG